MPEALLIVAPNWLGDAVMALPAIAGIRRRYPQARLTVAARPPVAPLFPLVPSVDEVVTLEWRGSLVARGAMRRDAERLREVEAEAAILLTNSFATAWLVRAAEVPERWGYASDLRRPLLSRAVRRPRRGGHQGAYYLHLVRELVGASGSLEPELRIDDAIVDTARALLASRGWDGRRPLLTVAPGAAYGTAKRWLPAHFGRLVDLAASAGVQVVLVGSRPDAETTAWVRAAAGPSARDQVIDLAGATTLEQLAGIMRLSAACVSNDSGAMHLAGAAGAPLAALFGPTREHETAPLVRAGGRAEVLLHPVWCRPCMLRECPIDHRCMRGLTPDRVWSAVDRLLHHA
jgi:heptosyltransferase-2